MGDNGRERSADDRAASSSRVVQDIEATLSRRQSGRITVEFDGGSLSVTTDGTPWCSEVSEAELRSFADRLAAVFEDPYVLLAATDTGDFASERPEKLARRRIELRRTGKDD